MTTAPRELLPVKPLRLGSIDAYRGLVMFLMMAEVSKAISDSGFWQFLTWHQTHVRWAGCTLHDLIQPSFSLVAQQIHKALLGKKEPGFLFPSSGST